MNEAVTPPPGYNKYHPPKGEVVCEYCDKRYIGNLYQRRTVMCGECRNLTKTGWRKS